MIVSHQRQIAFIHNPKCGGTGFRGHIGHLHDDETTFWDIRPDPYLGISQDYAHLRLWELQLSHAGLLARLRHYQTLIFVRNPFRRLVSALVQHIRTYRPEFDFDAIDRAGQHRAFRQVVGELTVERVMSDYRYVHFSPQHWFLSLPGEACCWTVLPLTEASDSFLRGFDVIGMPRPDSQEHASVATPLMSILTEPWILLFVHEFYAADFAAFERLGMPAALTALPAARDLATA